MIKKETINGITITTFGGDEWAQGVVADQNKRGGSVKMVCYLDAFRIYEKFWLQFYYGKGDPTVTDYLNEYQFYDLIACLYSDKKILGNNWKKDHKHNLLTTQRGLIKYIVFQFGHWLIKKNI